MVPTGCGAAAGSEYDPAIPAATPFQGSRMSLEFGRFEALTFDCYGTLIDWEAGILAGLRPLVDAAHVSAPDETILEAYARHEAALEAGPYLRYREVLARAAAATWRDLAARLDTEAAETFAGSVGDWPAFPDSAGALARLKRRYRLGVITNCDDDLFAASAERLGVDFDWVITAQSVGSYKPNERNFHVALERIGMRRDHVLHVAQSLYHDHVPAKRLGFATAWINRRAGAAGFGATPPADATPDLTAPDLASFADAALA